MSSIHVFPYFVTLPWLPTLPAKELGSAVRGDSGDDREVEYERDNGDTTSAYREYEHEVHFRMDLY